MVMTARSVALALVLGACSSEDAEEPAVSPPRPPSAQPREVPPDPETARRPPPGAAPAPAKGTADLTFTGAVEEKLEGPIVTCGFTRLDGKDQGGTWRVDAGDFTFQIMALTDEELDSPKVIMNVTKPERASYAARSSAKVKTARDRTVAEIDAELKNIVGAQTVHVKGTMTCPPLHSSSAR